MNRVNVGLTDYEFTLPNGERSPGGVYVENADKIRIIDFLDPGSFSAKEIKSILVKLPDERLMNIGSVLFASDLLDQALQVSGGSALLVYDRERQSWDDGSYFLTIADCVWDVRNFDVRTESEFERELFDTKQLLQFASGFTGRYMEGTVDECRGRYSSAGIFVSTESRMSGRATTNYYVIMLAPDY